MKKKKANIIRSLLLNKINNEIIAILKTKNLMRINGKKVEELYKLNCITFEVCIIHKLTIGNTYNKDKFIKNSQTFNNNNLINPLELYEHFTDLNEIENLFQGKKLISEKKLNIIKQLNPKKSEIKLINEKKKLKEAFITLKKIIHNLINKTRSIHSTKITNNNKILRIKKSKNQTTTHCKINSFTFNKGSDSDSDFKIKLISMSHRGPSRHIKLNNSNEKKSKRKKNTFSSQILSNVINNKLSHNHENNHNNKNKRKSIFLKQKLDLAKILKLNEENKNEKGNEDNEKEKSSLTSRSENTRLTLLYDDSS